MKSVFTQHNNATRLILFFSGWGMDPEPFRNLQRDGYDVLVVYDYVIADGDVERLMAKLEGYAEIVVVAWSFGVFFANLILKGRGLPVSAAIAVNGTLYPVDDRRGIPYRVFALTLRTLSEKSVKFFNLRMCGPLYDTFAANAPKRDIESLRKELEVFATSFPGVGRETDFWTRIIVSRHDVIFPPDNQLAAWGEERCTIIEDGTHYIDFEALINRYVVAKDIVAGSFSRHSDTYDAYAGIQHRVAQTLWQRLAAVTERRDFDTVIEIGSGTGLLTRQYLPHITYKELKLWDITGHCPAIDGITADNTVCCDAEMQIREMGSRSVDLILSSATLQWFNDIERFIKEVTRVLRPGGIAALAYFTDGTCGELSSVTGNSLAYPPVPHDIPGTVLSASESLSSVFDTPSELFRHLRLTGVNALGTRAPGASTLRRLITAYPLSPDGKARLTYNVVYLIIKA